MGTKVYPLLMADQWDEGEGDAQYHLIGIFSTPEIRDRIRKQYIEKWGDHYLVNDWNDMEIDEIPHLLKERK